MTADAPHPDASAPEHDDDLPRSRAELAALIDERVTEILQRVFDAMAWKPSQ